MRTIDGRECEIIEETFSGMAGEPVTILKIKFDEDNCPLPLNNDTLVMFQLADREALVEYMDDTAEMNHDNAISWTI